MLSTRELEIEIKNTIKQVLPDLELTNINFCLGNESSSEGVYIFSENNKYHYLFTERGSIRVDRIFDNVREVLWYVVRELSFDISNKYAIKYTKDGEDFRRKVFEKELEFFSLFGEDFRDRKEREIQDILLDYPYVDKK
jgi:hypothetical protein